MKTILQIPCQTTPQVNKIIKKLQFRVQWRIYLTDIKYPSYQKLCREKDTTRIMPKPIKKGENFIPLL
jgi:hypothetical protein